MPGFKATLLIVDDIKANLMVLEDLLSSMNINVIKAEDGKSAIKKAQLHKPDLILLDIIMPAQDGFEVCTILKNDEQTKDIPIIFLTGKDRSEDIIKGFEAGAVDYITKPFNTKELLARVKTHLELKNSRDIIARQNEQLKIEIGIRKRTEKELVESERKYSGLITGLSDAVFRMSFPEGKYEYISPAAQKVFGYSKNSFYKTPFFINKILHPDYIEYYENNLETEWGVAPTLKYKIIDPEGSERWIVQANKGTFNKEGTLIAIEGIYRNISTEEELENQKNKLEIINKNITSSIRYAQFIQQAVLPSSVFIKQFIPENFILYIPRDIVSGDFYWIKQVNNFVAIAAADCTGHGVPGAFMSMLGVALLNEIVRLDKHPQANDILNELRKRIKASLHQENVRGRSTDGMDMSLCIIDLEKKEVQYAGANSPLYIINEDINTKKPILTQYKPDRMPVGVYVKERSFTNHRISLQTNDTLYIFSDGYIDQFGGEKKDKFKSKRFQQLLLSVYHEPMEKQKELIFENFEQWRSGVKQLDDVLVIGVKIQDDYGDIDFF